jgi:hypothetical protein
MAVQRIAIVIVVLAFMPVVASAQLQETGRPVAWDVARAVLIDPTTYAPAVISYETIHWDWKTSQVLFAHGWVEANPRFTISGRPNDTPVTYVAGRRVIRGTALSILQYSVVNNLAAGISARVLASRYPSHKKLIRTLSWIERIGFASFVTYRNSADHVRQARTNRRLAREYGYVAP